jgi:hypothetical protein
VALGLDLPRFSKFFAGFRVWSRGITGYLSAFAAVEEFALQNFPQTRAILRCICPFGSTTRLAPNFHHKHIQPPLAGFCAVSFTHKLE